MRPKKEESEKRRNRIDVRFTDAEYELLMNEMEKTTNRTKGDFIREKLFKRDISCLLYTSPSPRDRTRSRMPSSA